MTSQVHPGPQPRLGREVQRTSRSRAPGADRRGRPCTSTHHLSGVPGIQVCLLMNAFRALVVVGPTCDPGSPSEEEVPGVTSWRSGLTPSFLLWCSRHTPSPPSSSSSSTASRSSRVRASSAGRYSGGLGFWGWWWFGRAMLSSEREPACPATLPQIPIPAC